jgi:hypothetical protein
MALLPFALRASWLVLLLFTLIYILVSSVQTLGEHGSLSGCFACPNGWNWHILLMTIAYPVAMVEAFLAFAYPISSR